MTTGVSKRKQEHLEICATQDVEARGTTLLEQVHLFHEALPDLSVSEIDLSVELLGRVLRAPLVIGGMTGGTGRAREINLALATVAHKHGIGFGLGSQRAMWIDPETASTYQVRDAAPDTLVLGNIGAVQAREMGVNAVHELVDATRADALCVHLNVAQELVQDDGDRDFRGCLDAIGALVDGLPVPVVAKETGCGFAPATLARLYSVGVRTVEIAGAGGTTWPGVEGLRGSERQRMLGSQLREWGIPTAPSVVYARRAGLQVIASGGVRSARDIVAGLALGATATAMALPYLRAYEEGGVRSVHTFVDRMIEAVRASFLLVGAKNLDEIGDAPKWLGPELRGWIDQP